MDSSLRHWSWRRLVVIAALLSLIIHGMLWIWFFYLRVGFKPSSVDPLNPTRINVTRAIIDPKSLESEVPTRVGSNLQASEEVPIRAPDRIAAFEGPIKVPEAPSPRIVGELTMPLSAEASSLPIASFSALPLDLSGDAPQIAQAMLDAPSTSALQEASRSLIQTPVGGGSYASRDEVGVPGFEDLSAVIKPRPAQVETRPQAEPILLRLKSDVLFEFDRADLKPEAYETLRQVAKFIAGTAGATATIEGHTDTFGDEDYNLRLSLARAQAVADWMIRETPLTAAQLSVAGYGKSRPIANPNGTKEEQAVNRRVEIRIQAQK